MNVNCPYCGETMIPATDRENGLDYYFCPVCLSQSAMVKHCINPDTGEEYTVSLRNGDRMSAKEEAMRRTYVAENDQKEK